MRAVLAQDAIRQLVTPSVVTPVIQTLLVLSLSLLDHNYHSYYFGHIRLCLPGLQAPEIHASTRPLPNAKTKALARDPRSDISKPRNPPKGSYRSYIGVNTGCIGIMEKKMETTIWKTEAPFFHCKTFFSSALSNRIFHPRASA